MNQLPDRPRAVGLGLVANDCLCLRFAVGDRRGYLAGGVFFYVLRDSDGGLSAAYVGGVGR